ncbi:hypothetical protein R1flu_019699 [Riccia fluitans]|uniref:Uncharacterized protein n=1 Tax=Riccia fluitans TaxID=41844 RepID=A0ABD1ZJE1_9MARC
MSLGSTVGGLVFATVLCLFQSKLGDRIRWRAVVWEGQVKNTVNRQWLVDSGGVQGISKISDDFHFPTDNVPDAVPFAEDVMGVFSGHSELGQWLSQVEDNTPLTADVQGKSWELLRPAAAAS